MYTHSNEASLEFLMAAFPVPLLRPLPTLYSAVSSAYNQMAFLVQ